MNNFSDRLRGVAVGAVVGDALGMPLEFQPPHPFYDLVTEMLSDPLPAGSFTDDTEMALALAESIKYCNPLNAQDLAGRFTGWFQSHPSDVGIHTAHVLQQIANGTPWYEASEAVYRAQPNSAGNGSLMRCWPVAIARWQNAPLLIAETRLQSEVTHQHPDSINGCVFVNLIIQKLIQRSENTPPDAAMRNAVQSALEKVDLCEEFKLAVDLAPVRNRDDLKNTGWVRHTVESALWAVLTTKSFEEALVQAVNLGWDADTTGCVTGAIAGALYGLHAIPERWKTILHGEYPLRSGRIWVLDDFINLADQLSSLPEKT